MAPSSSTTPLSAKKKKKNASFSSSSYDESSIALTLGILGVGGIGKEFILQLTESMVLENKVAIAFIANSRKEIRFKTPFVPSEHSRELLETLFDGTSDLAIWAKNLYEVLHVELDIVPCSSLKERQRIVLDDVSPSLEEEEDGDVDAIKNVSDALGETSLDAHTSKPWRKGRYCIVDMTSSDEIADLYHVFLALGVHVVTPNKKCNSGPTARDQKCRGLSSMSWSTASWFYEATIGAGLPIISTLRNLTSSGDEVYQIKGVFSGTMSYLFNTYDGSIPFSEVVKTAKKLGYTEPDAREDLNGQDVARKVVIAARESGWLDASIEKTSIESLVPEELRACSSEEFDEKFGKMYDGVIAQKFADAKKRGNVLRFCGSADLRTKELKVELMEFPMSHAFANLQGSQNVVEIESKRYNPTDSCCLTISGPGAGAAVTAGGVLGDVAKLVARLGDVEVLL
jgi:homoserine dehydrogenase